MKKIFILTGEPSGDKLASTVISKLKIDNPDIERIVSGALKDPSTGGNPIKMTPENTRELLSDII